MARLKPGDKAPAFSLQDQEGKTVRLSDYEGRHLLIYFYPKADTPGCTTQACSIRDSRQPLKSAALETVGISPDPPSAQKRFDQKYGLGYPLLSDPDHAAADDYGVWGEKESFGKKSLGIIRSSFLVDGQGRVVQAWYKVKPEDTVPRALEALQAGA